MNTFCKVQAKRGKYKTVVYFDQLSVAAGTWQLVRMIFWPFFGNFQTFFFLRSFFIFFNLKSRKSVFFSNSLKLVDTQTLVDSLSGYPIFNLFWFFLSFFNFWYFHSLATLCIEHFNKHCQIYLMFDCSTYSLDEG